MNKEIERKFLVKNNLWEKDILKKETIIQAYMHIAKGIVRIRIANNTAFLTIKSKGTGISRDEFEYEIPISEAKKIITNLCDTGDISKIRYHVKSTDKIWVVDRFNAKNKGLILAEIELKDENEFFKIPPWAGKEVSNDPRYFNSNLVKKPFSKW